MHIDITGDAASIRRQSVNSVEIKTLDGVFDASDNTKLLLALVRRRVFTKDSLSGLVVLLQLLELEEFYIEEVNGSNLKAVLT